MKACLTLISARPVIVTLFLTLAFITSPSLADRTQLYLPELSEDRFPGTREETFNYFKFDYSVPLAYQEEQLLFLPRWLRDTLLPVTSPLFKPGRDPYEPEHVKSLWWESGGRRVPQHTADYINDMFREAPPVLLCVYHRRAFIEPASFRPSMTGLHTDRVILAFWAQEPPSRLAPANLRELDGFEKEANPIILVGPYIHACPENLGTALETLASNAPGEVPATDPGFAEDMEHAFTGRAM